MLCYWPSTYTQIGKDAHKIDRVQGVGGSHECLLKNPTELAIFFSAVLMGMLIQHESLMDIVLPTSLDSQDDTNLEVVIPLVEDDNTNGV